MRRFCLGLLARRMEGAIGRGDGAEGEEGGLEKWIEGFWVGGICLQGQMADLEIHCSREQHPRRP